MAGQGHHYGSSAHILALQRTVGNRSVQRLLSAGGTTVQRMKAYQGSDEVNPKLETATQAVGRLEDVRKGAIQGLQWTVGIAAQSVLQEAGKLWKEPNPKYRRYFPPEKKKGTRGWQANYIEKDLNANNFTNPKWNLHISMLDPVQFP